MMTTPERGNIGPDTGRILCFGESLIDSVRRGDADPVEHVGGSILNVACGLARLGHRASLCSWWGRDARGERIAEAVRAAGVAIEPGTDGASRTTVAHARVDEDGRAAYTFDVEWDAPPLLDLAGVEHLHVGCFSATREPGGSRVVEAARRVRGTGTVSYDPNIRPSLMGTPEQVLPRVEELVALSDVVKASDEDLRWLYPRTPVEDVLRGWLGRGPSMVVATRGRRGAYAMLRRDPDLLVVDQETVDVADTVGAGDSFMAGLISGLVAGGLLGGADPRAHLMAAQWPDVRPALRRAVITSALTVSRHGAYAPTLADVLAAPATQPERR